MTSLLEYEKSLIDKWNYLLGALDEKKRIKASLLYEEFSLSYDNAGKSFEYNIDYYSDFSNAMMIPVIYRVIDGVEYDIIVTLKEFQDTFIENEMEYKKNMNNERAYDYELMFVKAIADIIINKLQKK